MDSWTQKTNCGYQGGNGAGGINQGMIKRIQTTMFVQIQTTITIPKMDEQQDLLCRTWMIFNILYNGK